MLNEDQKKQIVREKYSEIVLQDKVLNAASCCGATNSSKEVYNIMMDDYSDLEGYAPAADLGLGCGLPTEFAHINVGDTVIDLGSGAGNDCFVARHLTGASGKVIGIDFTPAMVNKARANADQLGYNNVEFREGDIDQMPVSDNTADVVVSNCVLNLVPNKAAVIGDMFRVLKPGGHFSISDIVLQGDLPEALQHDAQMYAGCVSGAMQKADYLNALKSAGFSNITEQRSKTITIPDDILERYLDASSIAAFKAGKTGIFSITVYGEKPGVAKPKIKVNMADLAAGANACNPQSGCC